MIIFKSLLMLWMCDVCTVPVVNIVIIIVVVVVLQYWKFNLNGYMIFRRNHENLKNISEIHTGRNYVDSSMIRYRRIWM